MATITPVARGARGEAVKVLQKGLVLLGRLRNEEPEIRDSQYGLATARAVEDFQTLRQLPATGNVDEVTARELNRAIASLGPSPNPPPTPPPTPGLPVEPRPPADGDARPLETANPFLVEGTVSSAASASVVGLLVEIVDTGIKGDAVLADTKTDESGRYRASIAAAKVTERGKLNPDLFARAKQGDTVLGVSATLVNAERSSRLDIVIEAAQSKALKSEHETLAALAAPHVTKFASLVESKDRSDITYLARKIGWDARSIAMATTAERLAAPGGATAAIAAPFYYALLRSGLPGNPETLFLAQPAAVQKTWEEALDKGIIPAALKADLPRARDNFEKLAVAQRLDWRPIQGGGALKEMIGRAFDNNADQMAKFADLHARFAGNAQDFWKEVTNRFGEPTARKLRVDNRLSMLTLNNTTLMARLHAQVPNKPIENTRDLARRGLYAPEAWNTLVAGPPPALIAGASEQENRNAYSQLLAANVRIAYPTASVTHMLASGTLTWPGADAPTRQSVVSFLDAQQGKYEIGVTPIQQVVARTAINVDAKVLGGVKRLERVYQMSSDDKAMQALLAKDLDSAYRIARRDRSEFVETFKADLGGEEQAALIHDRATTIHASVLGLATAYGVQRGGISIGFPDPPMPTIMPGPPPGVGPLPPQPPTGGVLQPAPLVKGADVVSNGVVAYPTLEQLFGSMDFCACEHCRSWLSPAAYLVDLLHFLEPADSSGTSPLAMLLARRPDLEHLPLTCENTSTALPYIDVVNETLEYYVTSTTAGNPLTGYRGHDTGDKASADLLANPQYVVPAAYATLAATHFPPPLPYDRFLDSKRQLLAAHGVSLAEAMERLRKTDALEPGAGMSHAWRQILNEDLGLSPVEADMLSSSARVPLSKLLGFADGTAAATIAGQMANAKTFARRVGITYEDLVALLKARFVNPASTLVRKLERLGVGLDKLRQLAATPQGITNAEFNDLLPAGSAAIDPRDYGATSATADPATTIRAWLTGGVTQQLDRLITLSEVVAGGDPCDFGNLEMRFARQPNSAADRIGEVELLRLIRFVRLWRKTGWTIEQTDAAILALWRVTAPATLTDSIGSVAALDTGFAALLPRLGVVVRVLRQLDLAPATDLEAVLACFGNISTHGGSALYRRMFLDPATLAQAPVFGENAFGEVLTTAANLLDHAAALRAALRLTAREFEAIARDRGFGATTPLTLTNISAIFRRGFLARALGISIDELLGLGSATGIDPFAAPDIAVPAAGAAISTSAPVPALQFIDLVEAIRARGLSVVQALYVVWNLDLTGQARPPRSDALALARALRRDLLAIGAEVAQAGRSGDAEAVRAQVALVYGPEPADIFVALLDNRLPLEVAYTQPTAALDPTIVAVDGALRYDHFRGTLSRIGAPSDAQKTALRNAAGATPAFRTAIDALATASADKQAAFFSWRSELAPAATAFQAQAGTPAENWRAALAKLQPVLVERRKRRRAVERLAEAVSVDPSWSAAALDAAAAPYPLASIGASPVGRRPALDDFLTAETAVGLKATFFNGTTATGAPVRTDAEVATLDYGAANPLPANPAAGAPVLGVWSGGLEALESGLHNLIVETDGATAVTIAINGQDRPMTSDASGKVWRNSGAIELTAGVISEFELRVTTTGRRMRLAWESATNARSTIPPDRLYPPGLVDKLATQLKRTLKVATLAKALALTERELVHLATDPANRIDPTSQQRNAQSGLPWPNLLPDIGAAVAPLNASLLAVVGDVLDFVRMRPTFAGGENTLVSILAAPAAAVTPPSPSTSAGDAPLFKATGWSPASLDALKTELTIATADLGRIATLRRLHDAFAVLAKAGVSASALIGAVASPASEAQVRDLEGALRARYDAGAWRDVVRPINDKIRAASRDALVATVLHRLRSATATRHIDTPDKLFEHLLMDVQMEPCMQTSRIRHALSSVQLFIERVFLNLELGVKPSTLNAKQWQWMKRYRVWEANRKVFLFPENWLEPELRDDKSPIYKEIESELLQSDITEDSAASALLTYLARLDEVAKLEPAGFCHIEASVQPRTDEVDHVVGRTGGGNRKYYYRSRKGGSWLPWEPIKLEIEDNPVLPVVWNDRLLLFWLKVMQETPIDPNKFTGSGTDTAAVAGLTANQLEANATERAKRVAKIKVSAVLCWSEHVKGKWGATRTSDIAAPLWIGDFDPTGTNAFMREQLLPTSFVAANGALQVSLRYGNWMWGSSGFTLYNTHSTPATWAYYTLGGGSLPPATVGRSFAGSPQHLLVGYEGQAPATPAVIDSRNSLGFDVLQPGNQLSQPDRAPFFFEDQANTFFVTVDKGEVWVPPPPPPIDVPPPDNDPYPWEIPPHARPRTLTGFRPIPQPRPPGPNEAIVGPRPAGLSLPAIDPASSMGRFVTEDAVFKPQGPTRMFELDQQTFDAFGRATVPGRG